MVFAEVRFLWRERNVLRDNTIHREDGKLKEKVASTIWIMLIAVLVGGSVGFAAKANANPGIGCETVRWGFLGSQRRTICDKPRNPDGSWERLRIIWTPAGYVPRRTSCGSYTCSSTGGYHQEQTIQGRETYIVFDYNVLPDEPGWLPTGMDVIRP